MLSSCSFLGSNVQAAELNASQAIHNNEPRPHAGFLSRLTTFDGMRAFAIFLHLYALAVHLALIAVYMTQFEHRLEVPAGTEANILSQTIIVVVQIVTIVCNMFSYQSPCCLLTLKPSSYETYHRPTYRLRSRSCSKYRRGCTSSPSSPSSQLMINFSLGTP